MKDFALTSDNDLDMSGTDMNLVNDIFQLSQNLKIRLQTFLGEWYLNTTIGIPYFQEIFIKNPNEIVVTNYLKKVIKETDGIINIKDFSFVYDKENPSKRAVDISFKCDTEFTKNYIFNFAIPING
jgi:hypothetical protein